MHKHSQGFIQNHQVSNKSERPINFAGIDNVLLKCDCIEGSVVKGVRELLLFSLGLDKPLRHRIYKGPRIKLFKKINKTGLSHVTPYLEDDDDKAIVFSGETLSFTCQLIKNIYLFELRYVWT